MAKDILNLLHLLFVIVLYAASWANLIVSVPNRDVYNLAMAIILYILAIKHERMVSEESEEEDGKVDSIPKAEYEARLKADTVATLAEIQLEIEESCICTYEVNKLIQQKINELKGEHKCKE